MKKIFQVIYYLIVVFIAIVAFVLIISILPLSNNFKILAVLSGSMEPTIHTGSVVLVKPASNYHIGDIITFGEISKTQTPTTHRISEIRLQAGQPRFITKGDANNAPDLKEVSMSEVKGKVLFSIPYAGFVVNFAKQPIGFLLIIIIPAIVIIIDEARKIYAELKKKKEKTD